MRLSVHGLPSPFRNSFKAPGKGLTEHLLQLSRARQSLYVRATANKLAFDENSRHCPGPSHLPQNGLDLVSVFPVLQLHGQEALAELLKLLEWDKG